ncbi:putative Hybrid PKS-NRPS biosynthetic cluster [Pyricularia oryzae]|nr:putative Hybrid PKS-NRPS biosynthetic cluster [Pyricularia oryzae]
MEPVAIIGYSLRFPGGADTPSKFWELLTSGRDISREPDPRRLNLSKFHHAKGEHHGSSNVLKSYFLDQDPCLFDGSFFGISPLEAEAMDPQQRLLLETVYEAAESAGATLEGLRGSRTSVHVGVMTGDYADVQARDAEDLSSYTASGTSRAMLANRVSYALDLRGPSVCIDTACSSSLVALHQAVRDLAAEGDAAGSDMAIVAGCGLLLDPLMYIAESKLRMLSPTGTSKMWDAAADGYARGEGVAAVLLKPLSRALRDGDPIRGVVRATGVNSDGRTPGITMPSAEAQASLIWDTYRAAGLDPFNVEERCQYFEAHGTGTPAGDPVEARGIFKSFFDPESAKKSRTSEETPLLVGSVKTIIGHLEGCAGLAGVIKVLVAMEHDTIPPNLHLKRLNPEIEPLSRVLKIPTESRPWPTPAAGQPKRASVNSFGFGGTNAHAIIESFDGGLEKQDLGRGRKDTQHDVAGRVHTWEGLAAAAAERPTMPIVLSAHSEQALQRQARNLLEFLRDNPSMEQRDLAWTLFARRSELGVRMSIPAAKSRGDLEQSLQETLSKTTAAEKPTKLGEPPKALASPDEGVGILGVFTGQGAQWAGMGRELMLHNGTFRRAISRCQDALATLPVVADRPAWSLAEELSREEKQSRIAEAEFAQPCTTAVEVALVDVLAAHGVRFSAVVGHSSGEMAACYAAGILTLRDAVRIAYYRGRHARLARSSGAMLAVGLGWDAAEEQITAVQRWRGRLWLAARNSPSSVTISGDADAVEEAHAELQQRGVFSRLLRTGKAYHSPHMEPSAGPYLQSMRACGIKPTKPTGRSPCVWISSVTGTADMFWDGDFGGLASGQYWVDNMVQPVLFADAVTAALTNGGPFDAAIEVGPHPALKGPVGQTVQAHLKRTIPYCGAMNRGADCVTSLSEALGFLWRGFGGGALRHPQDPGEPRPRMVKDLPPYAWDHTTSFWRESRVSRNHRLRPQDRAFLLGRRCPDDTDAEPRWRNMLSLAELPWLRGHAFEGEALYPAAAYLVMLLEVAQFLAAGREVAFVQLSDVSFNRTLAIPEGGRAVEIITSAKVEERKGLKDGIRASVGFSVCRDPVSGAVDTNMCTGSVEVFLAGPDEGPADFFMPRAASPNTKTRVDVDDLYSMFDKAGIEYRGVFRGLVSLSRSTGLATATASWKSEDIDCGDGLVHPGLIDTCIHPVVAAFATPEMGRVKSAYLPQKLKRLIFNPKIKLLPGTVATVGTADTAGTAGTGQNNQEQDTQVVVDAYVSDAKPSTLVGDFSIYLADEKQQPMPLVQVEGLSMTTLGRPDPIDDRVLFSRTIWKPDLLSSSDSDDLTADYRPLQNDMIIDAERVSLFTCRKIVETAEKIGIQNLKKHEQMWVAYAQETVNKARRGEQWSSATAIVNDSTEQDTPCPWLDDDEATIDSILEKHRSQVDFALLGAVKDEISAVFSNQAQMLEVLFADNMLGRYYSEGLGVRNAQRQVARYLEGISHRHPQADVIELGAGVGATTRAILDAVGADGYGSYTFTDVSAGFFSEARARFAAEHRGGRMRFARLDVAADLQEQGFERGAYDVVVAANVLHIAPDVAAALRRIRSLLRPGGFLVAVEPTGGLAQVQLILGGLEGWWLAADGCRTVGPQLSVDSWDAKLWDAGFSGLEVLRHHEPHPSLRTCSSFVSQALSDAVSCLRQPLAHAHLLPADSVFVLVGGATMATSRVVREVEAQLAARGAEVVKVRDVGGLAGAAIPDRCSVLYLAELDRPAVRAGAEDVDGGVLKGLQTMFGKAGSVFFMTRGAGRRNPSSNMLVGLCRTLRSEVRSLRLQVLDLEDDSIRLEAALVLEHFLRFVMSAALGDEQLLFTDETELLLKSDGMLYIPRIRTYQELNDRVNTSRRNIWAQVGADDHVLELRDPSNGKMADMLGCELVATPKTGIQGTGTGTADCDQDLMVHVKYSTLIPILNTQGMARRPAYLCFGVVQGDAEGLERPVLALSSSNKSIVHKASWEVYFVPQEHHVTPITVAAVSLVLAVRAWVRSVPTKSTIWVHGDLDETTLATLEAEAGKVGVKIYWTSSAWGEKSKSTTTTTTTRTNAKPGRTPVLIHRNMPFRQLKATIPRGISAIITASSSTDEVSPAQHALGLKHVLCGHLFSPPPSFTSQGLTGSEMAKELEQVFGLSVSLASTEPLVHATVIPVGQASTTSSNDSSAALSNGLAVLDWTASATVRAKIQPIDASQLFKADKTYFLVGLTRDLGRSICEWMVRQGARHIALASRSPQLPQDWLRSMESAGVAVRVFSMDVTDYQAVRMTVSTMHDSMPPVAGVFNGSMLLSNKLFAALDAAEAMTAIRPKVDGSLHLERALAAHEAAPGRRLDFFLLFSSSGSVIGVPGQSGYHMANLFMSALAADRRARGLAASVIDIGILVEVGYVTRQHSSMVRNLRSLNMNPNWEDEIPAMLAEAIVAGRPGSARPQELIAGLVVSDDDANRPFWAGEPRFAFFVRDQRRRFAADDDDDADAAGAGGGSSESPMERLRAVLAAVAAGGSGGGDEVAELTAVIRDALAQKMEKMLQVQPGSLDMASPIVGLGVDSLLAMEVRQWVQKTVGADVSVLKILGGATGDMLAATAADAVMVGLKDAPPAKTVAPKTVAPKTVAPEAAAAKAPAAKAPAAKAPPNLPVPRPPRSASRMSDSTRSGSGSGTKSPILQATWDDEHSSGTTPSSPESTIACKAQGYPPASLGGASVVRRAPLSFNQERLWFLQHFLSDPCTYNETAMYRLRGPVDAKRLEAAFYQVLARHEIFRTRYQNDAVTGAAVQQVLAAHHHVEHRSRAFRSVDATHEKGEQRQTTIIETEFDAMVNRKWALSSGASIGMTLIVLPSSSSSSPNRPEHVLILGAHHIAVDGTTWTIFFRDLDRAYTAGHLSPPPGPQYADFALQQRSKTPANHGADMEFWSAELSGLPSEPIPLFPQAKTTRRAPLDRYGSVTARCRLDAAAASEVKRTSARLHMTAFGLHMAVLSVLVSHLSGTSDLCIGFCDGGRPDAFADTAGFFVNMLPVRLDTAAQHAGSASFADLARATFAKLMDVMAHSSLSLEALLDALAVPRSTTHSPLFQVVLNYRLDALAHSAVGDGRLEFVKARNSRNPYDVSLSVTDSPDGTCLLDVSMQESLYGPEAAASVLAMYRALMASVCRDGQVKVGDLISSLGAASLPTTMLTMTGAESGDTVLSEMSDESLTIWHKIKQASLQVGDSTAIHGEGHSPTLSYNDLTGMSSSMATSLQRLCASRGVETRGAFCALLLEPSADYVAALLAVFKLRAVAFPMDTTNHKQRLAVMAKDCRPSILLYHSRTKDLAAWLLKTCNQQDCIAVDVAELISSATNTYDSISLEPTKPTKPSTPTTTTTTTKATTPTPTELPGIILYTSGSTGTPKGVLQSSIGFDVSLMQIFSALFTGGSLVVCPHEHRRDPIETARLMRRFAVTTVFATPTEWTLLLGPDGQGLARCSSLRKAMAAGEMVTGGLAARFRRLEKARGGDSRLELFNVYGPTETCMSSNVGRIEYWLDENVQEPARVFAVGPPLDGVRIRVLGLDGNEVPYGAEGEVYIGGVGVGPGYLNRPDLTDAAFVPEPTNDLPAAAGSGRSKKMYRTRDKGYWLPDGSLMVCGRIDGDTQVKMHGIRIELEDVASAILAAADGLVSHAVATVRSDEHDKTIVAFVVPSPRLSPADAPKFLAELPARLPLAEYMRPAAILPLETLPLNASGKLDMAALAEVPLPEQQHHEALQPAPDLAAATSVAGTHNKTHEPPPSTTDLSYLEQELLSTWTAVLPSLGKQLLKNSSAHRGLDFFRVGGSSITLVVLRDAIRRRFRAHVPLLPLFENSTLGSMAAVVGRQVEKQCGAHWEFWDRETRFDPAMLPLPPPPALSSLGLERRTTWHPYGTGILLTGATTPLGSRLLQRFLSRPDAVRRVYCVALSPDQQTQLRRSPWLASAESAGRAELLAGDLYDATLGLSPSDVQRLRADADAIVHAGSEGSCLNSYASITEPNLDSTRFLATTLAISPAGAVKPLHLVSSARVLLFSGRDEHGASSVSHHLPPLPDDDSSSSSSSSREGFTATKWAAERLLENFAQAAAARGGGVGPVAVHRTGYLITDDAGEMDAVNMIRKYSAVLGAVPSMERFQGWLDMSDMEWVADRLARHVLDVSEAAEDDGKSPVCYVHHTQETPVPVLEFQRYMEDTFGRAFETVSMVEWTRRAVKVGLSPFMASFLCAVCEREGKARYPRLLVGAEEEDI